MSSFDQEKYDKAREAAHNYFQKNTKIQSPVLGTVHLNSDGFLHLVYGDKKHKQKRDWKNQLKRFHLVTHIKRIIEGMSFYQEYMEQYQTVMVKKHKHKEPVWKVPHILNTSSLIISHQPYGRCYHSNPTTY